MLLALTSLALADEGAAEFLAELDTPPFMVANCPRGADVLDLFGNRDELAGIGAEQLDPEAPVRLALIPGPGGLAMVYRSGQLDGGAWLAGEEARLRQQGWVKRQGRWESPTGQLATYEVEDGTSEVRMWLPMAGPEATGSIGIGDLDRVQTEGCFFGVGMRMPDGSDIVSLVEPRGEDRITGRVYGSAVQAAGTSFIALEPSTEARLHTTDAPDLYLRANLDIDAIAESWATGQGPTAALGQGITDLEDAGVRLSPGAEVAIWMHPMAPEVLAVVPLKRPRKASRVLKRLDRAGEGVLADDGVLAIQGNQTLFLLADGRDLLVSTNPTTLFALRDGEGELLGPHTADAGLHVHFSETAWAAALAASGRTDESLEGMPAFDLHLQNVDDALAFDIRAPGYRDWADRFIDARSPTATADPVGHPPSTEALSVLMSISTAQEKALEDRGRYLPYTGGPRAVTELDADAVAWEGIPELGIGSMDTACRYEVALTFDGYTARSICDEDGDGLHAVTVMTPGGRPLRVTPAEVR